MRETLVGQLVGGYQVERLLGRGSMGAVYAARNQRTGGLFAIKVLHPAAAEDPEIYERFRNEARVTTALRHPGLVQVFDFAELPDGSPYLVMEYLEGETLHARLSRVGRLPLLESLRLTRQIGAALQAAHRMGVVHRDLKPGNVLLVPVEHPDGTEEQARIIDFGVSRIRGALAGQQQTLDAQLIGTPQYMAPEAALGQNALVDGRSDQFALAVMLYRMLAGRLPFDADNQVVVLHKIAYEAEAPIQRFAPEVPPAVAEALHRALRKEQGQRFPTIRDFVRALDPSSSTGVQRVAPTAAQEPGSLAGTLSPVSGALSLVSSQRRLLHSLAAALLTLLVLAAALWMHQRRVIDPDAVPAPAPVAMPPRPAAPAPAPTATPPEEPPPAQEAAASKRKRKPARGGRSKEPRPREGGAANRAPVTPNI